MSLSSQFSKLPKWPVIFATLCVAVYTAWSIAYPSGTWRYKLTVEIETPEGIKTGSAVREVHAESGPQILPDANPVYTTMRGESVVVDLGARGQVFALLKTYRDGIDGGFLIINRAYPFTGDPIARVRYYDTLLTDPVTLTAELYPMLVRFRDPQDPRTVENLLDISACPEPNPHPMRFCLKNDHFAEAFGDGVKLKSVTIALTDQPVTTGVVERYLPWIATIKSNIDGTSITTSRELSNNLDWGAFSRGKK